MNVILQLKKMFPREERKKQNKGIQKCCLGLSSDFIQQPPPYTALLVQDFGVNVPKPPLKTKKVIG